MLFFIKTPIILYICRHKHLINHDKIFVNKKKSLVLKSIAIILASCFIQQTINAQSSLKYKQVTLSYVDLSDSAKITSKPIKTRKIRFRNGDKSDNIITIELNTIINANLKGIGGAFNEQGGEAL